MRVTLMREAHKRDIPLRQSFKKVGKKAFIMQGRYASAKQMKRAARQTKNSKLNYKLNRNCLKGKTDDTANVTLSAAAYNMAKLLAWFCCANFLSQQI